MILVSGFIVTSRLKTLYGIESKSKKRTLPVHQGWAVLIATGANLLDTMYEFYGFNDDLIDTIT